MKYIQKNETPQFFIDDTKELIAKIKEASPQDKKRVWDSDYKNKRELKKYLLEVEQNWLCGYCEAKLKETFDEEKRENRELIHIEHIKPKHLDYDNLSFDYYNLLVSCSGKCFTDKNKPLTCGHKKANKFDEELFLNPIKLKDIRDYFIYTDNGYIGSSSKNIEKSDYMMNLLELNTFNNKLPEARKIALQEFKVSIKKYSIKEKKSLKEIIRILLNKENLAFISYLRYKYKNIL
jgi:uncharacterized protein (TIGR02646 family)